MFSQTNRGKIKNAKILSWRLELSQLHYGIRHKPGIYNVGSDALSRSCTLAPSRVSPPHGRITRPPGWRIRRFLRGVGVEFLTTFGFGAGFFVRLRLRMYNWTIFCTTTLNWEFLFEMVQCLLKLLLKQIFLAVHHDFH